MIYFLLLCNYSGLPRRIVVEQEFHLGDDMGGILETMQI